MTESGAPNQTHTFKRGDKVNIINQTMGGRFVLEGRATILKRVAEVDEQYVVRFFDESAGRSTYERFVDPAAQDGDLSAYLAKLNSRAA